MRSSSSSAGVEAAAIALRASRWSASASTRATVSRGSVIRPGPGYLCGVRRASAPVPGEKPRPGKERTCARRGHLSTRYSENVRMDEYAAIADIYDEWSQEM